MGRGDIDLDMLQGATIQSSFTSEKTSCTQRHSQRVNRRNHSLAQNVIYRWWCGCMFSRLRKRHPEHGKAGERDDTGDQAVQGLIPDGSIAEESPKSADIRFHCWVRGQGGRQTACG